MLSGLKRVCSPGGSSGLGAELVSGGLGVGGLRLLSLILNLALSILLARVLGPDGYGQYAFILSVVMVLSIPVNQGLGQLLTREVARQHHGREWGLIRGIVCWAHGWVGVGCGLLWLVMVPLAITLADWRSGGSWALVLVGLALLPLLGLNTVRQAVLRGLGYVVVAQLPDMLVRPGFHLLLASALLFAGILTPVTALGAAVVAAGLAFVAGTRLLAGRRPPEARLVPAAYRSREWARSWVPLTLLAGGTLLNNQVGILLLGWLGTDAQVGALRVADNGAQMVAASLMIINLVIAPHFIHAHRDGNQSRMQKLSRYSARAAFLGALAVAAPLLLFAAPVIEAVVGSAYVDLAAGPLAILLVGQLFNVAFGSVGLFLIMTGHERDSLIGQLVGLVVNVALALVLIPSLGAEGAAWASALGLVCWNVILAFMVWKRLKLRPGVL